MNDSGRWFEVDLALDVRAVAAFADNLTPYIYEEALYGHLSDSSLPRLTLGGLLMRLKRLAALSDQLSAAEQDIVAHATHRYNAVRAEWRVAFENKVHQELKARLNALEAYVAECSSDVRACADNYPSTMEKRVMVVHLQAEAEATNIWTDAYNGRLLALDNSLRNMCEAGPFCWAPKVQPAYPQEQFWFLYARVRVPPAR
jgi:hypothetical protein